MQRFRGARLTFIDLVSDLNARKFCFESEERYLVPQHFRLSGLNQQRR
jgi:hypothetical protein